MKPLSKSEYISQVLVHQVKNLPPKTWALLPVPAVPLLAVEDGSVAGNAVTHVGNLDKAASFSLAQPWPV